MESKKMIIIDKILLFAQTYPGNEFTIKEIQTEFPDFKIKSIHSCIYRLRKKGILVSTQRGYQGSPAKYSYQEFPKIKVKAKPAPDSEIKFESKPERKIMTEANINGNIILTKVQLADGIEELFNRYRTKIDSLSKKDIERISTLGRLETEIKTLRKKVIDRMGYYGKIQTLEKNNNDLKDQIIILNRKINRDIGDKYSKISIPNFTIGD